MRLFSKLSFVCALLIISSGNLYAADLLVPSQYSTIQSAIDVSSDGDNILVSSGIFNEGINFGGKDIDVVAIFGVDATTLNSGQSTAVEIGPNGRIAGFSITSKAEVGTAVRVNGNGSILENNIFENMRVTNVLAGVNISPIVRNNIFRNNTSCSKLVRFDNNSSPIFENNLLHDNGCVVLATSVNGDGVQAPLFANNVIVNNFMGWEFSAVSDRSNHIYRNNIIAFNGFGFRTEANPIGANLPDIDNNLLFGNTTDYINLPNLTGVNGNITADPLFLDRQNSNFHLKPGSPAIDSGSNLNISATDLIGISRPIDGNNDGNFEVDIGAYEYNPNSVIEFKNQSLFVNENTPNIAIPICRYGGLSDEVSVSYTTSDNTAINGTNYISTTGSILFAVNEGGCKTFNVDILDNNSQEILSFEVTLSNLANGVLVAQPNPVSILITTVPSATVLFPLVPGATYNYLVNSSILESETVLPQALFRGVQAFGLRDNQGDGDIEYYTNDASGLLDYGAFFPVEGQTVGSSPPLKFLEVQPVSGQVINQTGVFGLTDLTLGTITIRYAFSSTVQGVESVTVPLGTFDALRVDTTLQGSRLINGQLIDLGQTSSSWLVEDIGEIRSVTTNSEGTETRELVSFQIPTPPEISSPTEGATLVDDTITVQWNDNGTNASLWASHAGTSPGATDLAVSPALASNVRQHTLTGLPTDGSTIYITLFANVNGVWSVVDTNMYTAFTGVAQPPTTPEISLPVEGTTLVDDTITVQWNDNGTNASLWASHAGTSPGATDLAVSPALASNVRQHTLTGLPTDGSTIYITLFANVNGVWSVVDTNMYTAFTGVAQPPTTPEISLPVEGTTLVDDTITVQWNDNGTNASLWASHAGTSPGATDLAVSPALASNVRQHTLTGLPTDGSTIYITLFANVNGVWSVVDTNMYTAFTGVAQPPTTPEISSPTEGATLVDDTITVQWNDNGTNASLWASHAGTSPGATDLAVSPALASNVRQHTLTGLPTDGSTIYITLFANVNGVWSVVDTNMYTAFTGVAQPPTTPEISSPTEGATLVDDTITVQWNDNGTNASLWASHAGTSPGATDLAVSPALASNVRQHTLTGLPTDGSTIYITLFANVNGVWSVVDTNMYTAFTGVAQPPTTPEISLPMEGTTLVDDTITVQWNDNGTNASLWASHAGTSPGATNLATSPALASNVRQHTLTGLPTDGSTIYITLFANVNGVWSVVDTNMYTALN